MIMKHAKMPLVILEARLLEFEEGFLSQVGITVLEARVPTKP